MTSGDRLSIERLRKRLPLAVFALLLILLVVMLGIVCVCVSDHPTQAVERALSLVAHSSAVVEVWAITGLLIAAFVARPPLEPVSARGRASPARLQRFLF